MTTVPATFAPHGTFRMGMRPYNPATDIGVVLDPWRKQLESIPQRSLHPRIFKMSAEDRQHHVDDVILPLVLRCPPLMACDLDYPTQVFGWLCGEHQDDRQVLHFLYVRNMWRKQGVATQLLRYTFPKLGRETLYMTHPTQMMRHHLERWCLQFNPYLVR